MGNSDNFWKGVAAGGGIASLITIGISVYLHNQTKNNEQRISRLESRVDSIETKVFDFENKYFADKARLDMEVNQIWNQIRQHEQALSHVPEMQNKIQDLGR